MKQLYTLLADAEGDTLATFAYHGDGSRASMHIEYTATQYEQRDYFGDRFQRDTRSLGSSVQQKIILYLGGTPYDAPAALVKDYGSNTWQLLHILRDNLGSITHIVDTTGTIVQELSYTPWGALRDPATLQPYLPDSQPDLLLDRGFTGHEHLTDFGLINMNARLYDPAAGRFLNPDPYVQAPDNTQNLNRYSYCLNNPLRYVDPTGETIWKTTDPGEIQSILDYIQNKGYCNVTIEGIQSIWNRNLWIDVTDDFVIPRPDYDLYYGTTFEGGGTTSGGDVVLIRPTVTGIIHFHPISIADPTMPHYTGADIANIINQSLITPEVKLTEHMWDIATLGKLGKDVKIGKPSTWPINVNAATYTKAYDPAMGKIAKGLKVASKGLTALNIAYTVNSLADDWGQSRYISAGARFGVSLITYSTGFIPIVGPFISTGIAIVDALYGEQFYQAIQERYGN